MKSTFVLIIGIIGFGYAAEVGFPDGQSYSGKDYNNDISLDGSQDLKYPSALRFMQHGVAEPAPSYDHQHPDKTTKSIESFNMIREPFDEFDMSEKDKEDEEEVEEKERKEEEEEEEYDEELEGEQQPQERLEELEEEVDNTQPDEIVVEESFLEDHSSESEDNMETSSDMLPNVIVEEEDLSLQADDTEQKKFATEVNEPWIVPQIAYLLGNEEGVRLEDESNEKEGETRIPVSEPWIVPKMAPRLGSEPEVEDSLVMPKEFRELETEFNRNAKRDHQDLGEGTTPYDKPIETQRASDIQGPSRYENKDAQWETEKVLDDSSSEIEEFVDTSNPVRLSRPRWPVRDMSRLGIRPVNRACSQTLDMGVGPEELSSWYYSHVDGRCQWFAYRGHGGNGNRFYSRAACEGLCVFEQTNLCNNVKCSYPGSTCRLRGDELCKTYKKSRGKDVETECPPDQPVCQTRRSFIAPELDTSLVPRECFEEYDPGSCLVKTPLIKYYYDAESNSCSSFYFHSCDGNDNRFESKEDCMNHCSL